MCHVIKFEISQNFTGIIIYLLYDSLWRFQDLCVCWQLTLLPPPPLTYSQMHFVMLHLWLISNPPYPSPTPKYHTKHLITLHPEGVGVGVVQTLPTLKWKLDLGRLSQGSKAQLVRHSLMEWEVSRRSTPTNAFAGMWKRLARQPCWLPRGQEV